MSGEGRCIYNLHIVCESHKGCEVCGWNPAVIKGRRVESRVRVAKLLQKTKPKDKWRWTYEEVKP